MNIVTNYLAEVGRFLPEADRADILNELRSSIEEEITEQAEHERKSPNEVLASRVLKRFGHPIKVAGRYQPEKYLVGPGLYPAYIQTLKVVTVVAFCIQIFVALAIGQSSQWQIEPVALLKMSVETLFWAFAIVTTIFVFLEQSGERLNWYESWSPESLLRGELWTIKRSDIVTNLLAEAVLLLWWNDVLVLQNWIPALADIEIRLSPAWAAFFWPVNVVFSACVLLHAYVLVKGVWNRWTLATEITTCAAVLYIIGALLTSGELLRVAGESGAAIHGHLQNSARGAMLVIAAITAWDLWLAVKLYRKRLIVLES